KKTLANLDIGKKKRRRKKMPTASAPVAPEEQVPTIQVTELATVAEVAAALDVDPSEVIAKCMELGLMVTMNRRLDKDIIETLADEFEHEVEFLSEYGEAMEEAEEVILENLVERPPVVTIMGHVDHGKTSLLDYIRKTNVIAGEVGGITQHIGAYEVQTSGGSITFLDTPGHEAFSAMRARGAQVTDIVVLVVAADDQVMPQTIEAIDHAKAASVPVIVAINKMDRPEANPMRIKQQLAERGLQVEEWGGKIVAVEVSAQTGQNIDKLLEMLLLEAELLELKADPKARARGTVIESRLEPGRGVVTTTLVQNGTLKVGDPFIAGSNSGRVRALFDERGKPKKVAGPSSAVEILGASSAPQAGDSFTVFPSEKDAKDVAAKRQQQLREQSLRYQKRMSLEDLFDQIQAGGLQTLNIVLKGDVDGSVEAVSETLQKLSTTEVKVDVIHKGVGTISESDNLLAAASNAIIIGFHTKADTKAAKLAEKEGVDIRFYQIIYEAVDDIRLAMEGMLTPDSEESVTGRVEVRQIFRIGRSHVVAGSYVLSGTVSRNSRIRVIREDTKIYEGKIQTLKRFKDDAREVKEGFECGITLENFNDIAEGDILEAFVIKEVARKL
ncbi:MAG: translation initiation factor IF-2, partial [Gemmatimonadetes bacterium]|nr:translation initiation factor IF-2 [Gemmatimonadota bacterium]